MYTKGQVSICKVGRDIKKESSFMEQIRGACWGRENGEMYVYFCKYVYTFNIQVYICIYTAMVYKYVPILSV